MHRSVLFRYLRITHRWMPTRIYCLCICLFSLLLVITINSSSPWSGSRAPPGLGTVVLDWTGVWPGVPDRSCTTCSNFTSQQTSSSFRCDSPFLLILVISQPKNTKVRAAIRTMWGSVRMHRNKKIHVLFVVGIDTKSKQVMQALTEEETKHHDFLYTGLPESYNALTNKSMAAFHWVNQYCRSAEYILKTDDDCYNNPLKFVDFLIDVPHDVNLVGGFCFTTRPNRNKKSHWYIPPEVYPDLYLPVYCGGPAYLLSKSALTAVTKVSSNLKFFHLEDIFVTGFCRMAAGMNTMQIPGVQASNKPSDCELVNDVLNIHKVSESLLPTLWNKALKPAGKCLQPKKRHPVPILLVFITLGLVLFLWILYKRKIKT